MKTEAREVGKFVHGALYLHRDAIAFLAEDERTALAAAERLGEPACWNVAKVELARRARVGLLLYEDFASTPFPALLESVTVDLRRRSVTRRSFRASDNPPILHRKELLLPLDCPDRERFKRLTVALEARGLFEDSRSIGFRQAWRVRLDAAGVRVDDHELVEVGTTIQAATPAIARAAIDRHRTAIARDRLSAPMQALARHGLIDEGRSVFDYGCGQGDDVRALRAGGIAATGWDPHFAPDAPLAPADVVNLGFVLNVIEEPGERVASLRRAYDLARGVLAVAVMIEGKGSVAGLRPYRDGYLTRRGTFQKYYRQDELRDVIEGTLGREAIAVAPGVFFAFRNELLEQRFLLDRQRRRHLSRYLDLRPPKERPTATQRRLEALRPILEGLWRRSLELGRAPEPSELDAGLRAEIDARVGSLQRAQRACAALFDAAVLAEAASARRDDLRVYFALNLFNRRHRYTELPPELQRDVKAFFKSHAVAQDQGRELLFSVGDPAVIARACGEAYDAGLGWLDEGHSLTVHSSLVERLPPALRCYVGCAAKLYGDVDGADLVKIHIRSGKLTLLFYDGFDASPLPVLRERVKIDLRAQRIDTFDGAGRPQLLYMKSRYMTPDMPGHAAQSAFDAALARLALFDFEGFGPDAGVFMDALQRRGYRIDGFALVPT